MAATFEIVSLCGSAGALDAYVEILRAAPADSGMAFVILTHRRAGTPSRLVEILSRVTSMPVVGIEDGTVLKPNRVYLSPAGMDVTIDGEAFQVVPSVKSFGWPNTFDLYLRSVALKTRDRAIVVILSGMSADGSAPLKQLKASGGTIYAQTDATAGWMPQNAIDTGNVNFKGTPAQIIASILSLRSHSSLT